MAQPIRVLIADDSARARDGLRALLVIWPEIDVIGEAPNGELAVRMAEELRPDVVLMDLQMPVLDGVQAIRVIKRRWPAMTVIALTMYTTEQDAALQAGADAFILKGSDPTRLLSLLGVRNLDPSHAPS
jgi:DNA-binding NarL/FixJ family response regulator